MNYSANTEEWKSEAGRMHKFADEHWGRDFSEESESVKPEDGVSVLEEIAS